MTLYIRVCVCMHVCVCSFAQSCPTLCNPMDFSPPGSFLYEIFPGKNIGEGCHFPFQGFFPSQGSNLHLFIYIHVKRSAQSLAHSYILSKSELI